jgi:tetratricopeptide (TPR) repeat protein
MELDDRITALRRVIQERLAETLERTRTRAVEPKPIDRQREALRLNAAGARLRREGSYDDAAEQHRQALTLFHDLGDQHSEALTLNNLALALDRAGDETALELFERAATTLGELGDEQTEGQVIANLAVAFRRRGEDEKSEDALDTALTKLRPESEAYRKVESLRRAS